MILKTPQTLNFGFTDREVTSNFVLDEVKVWSNVGVGIVLLIFL